MSFAQTNGYTPPSFDDIMALIREGINTQFGTTYDEVSFVGTNWYKFSYVIAQRVQQGEIKAAEVFQKLQQYIALTNEKIQRPSVSHPGLLDSFDSQGYVVSVKPPLEADAGKIFICVDVDDTAEDYADTKLAVCTLIKDYIAAGIVTMGDQVETLLLSNGQEFDFKYSLPNRIPVLLRLTAVKSRNHLLTIPSDVEIRQAIFNNIHGKAATETEAAIEKRYRLGWDFEPERYYGIIDAPWANDVTLEWSDDSGANWHPEVFEAEFDDLYDFDLEDIAVVIS